MSLFGKNTVDETRHLMKTVEFRIERTEPLVMKLEFSDANVRLVKDWNIWKERWDDTRKKVLDKILIIRIGQPLVKEHMLVSQEEYNMVQKAIGTPHEVIALSPIIGRFERETGTLIDEKGAPVPEGFDPDFAAYKAVDAKIRAAEAAAKEAADKAKTVAKSNTGLIVLGAVGLVLAGGIAAKVYL